MLLGTGDRRHDRRLRRGVLLSAVPTGSANWIAADVVDDPSWTIRLDDDQRNAIVDATRRAIGRGVSIGTMTAAEFPLEGMGAALARWSDALQSGRGVLLLRGFPIEELTAEEVELAYVGLGTHLGTPVGQNAAGDLLTHIRDERLPPDAGKVRLYRTSERQDFHTDAADIIGLLCLRRAASGGESKVASSAALIAEMQASRPDLLDELRAPLPWDRQNDVPDGAAPWFSLAPLAQVDGGIDGAERLFYVGWYIRDSQRHSDAPRLTDAQLEAMAMLEALANDPRFHLEMDFEPGDVQLVNNGRVLHAREAYEDDPDPDRRRHLLRLWLAAHRFASVESELRGGIATGRDR